MHPVISDALRNAHGTYHAALDRYYALTTKQRIAVWLGLGFAGFMGLGFLIWHQTLIAWLVGFAEKVHDTPFAWVGLFLAICIISFPLDWLQHDLHLLRNGLRIPQWLASVGCRHHHRLHGLFSDCVSAICKLCPSSGADKHEICGSNTNNGEGLVCTAVDDPAVPFALLLEQRGLGFNSPQSLPRPLLWLQLSLLPSC